MHAIYGVTARDQRVVRVRVWKKRVLSWRVQGVTRFRLILIMCSRLGDQSWRGQRVNSTAQLWLADSLSRRQRMAGSVCDQHGSIAVGRFTVAEAVDGWVSV